jgi:hypothetical protein
MIPEDLDRFAARTAHLSKHVRIENVGRRASLQVSEIASDTGELLALHVIPPRASAQYTPTGRSFLHVTLCDGCAPSGHSEA